MELNIFIKHLEGSLINRGISPDVVDKHIHTLQRTFTDDDLREIQSLQSAEEVEEIAENIYQLLQKNKIKARTAKPAEEPTEPQKKTAQPQPKPTPPQEPAPKPAPEPITQKVSTKPVSSAPRPRKAPVVDDDPLFFDDNDYAPKKNSRGAKGFYIFWLVFIFTLPITIGLAAAFFGVFIGAFAALSALIVGLIAALIALVAVGAAVSLVGIIFGITQLFSFVAAGVYEIGLGVMVIGVVMLAGILIYNFAIRFLPWVIRKVWTLMIFTCGKIRDLFMYLRRECYKL